MSRKWTSRMKTTLAADAIDADNYAHAYTISRADLEPSAARKQAFRVFTGYALLALPVHCGIWWLAASSLPLAVALVLGVVALTFAVALAKWLELDDVLQRLPIILALALLVLVVAFFMGQPGQRWATNLEMFGGIFVVLAVFTLLGGLYRPMAAAYQTATTKVPCRELCAAGGALLASLGLVALAQSLPRPVILLVAAAVCGGYAGLVVLEYAAWARSNPAAWLERVQKFDERLPKLEGERPEEFETQDAIVGAMILGLSMTAFVWLIPQVWSPATGFLSLVPASESAGPPEAIFFLYSMLGASFFGIVLGLLQSHSSMRSSVLVHPFLACRLAGHALVLFLTYPETRHPLVHQIRTAWLRPLATRRILTGLALAAVTTTVLALASSPKPPPPESPPKVNTPPVLRQPAEPIYERQGDIDLAIIEGRGRTTFGSGSYVQAQPPPPPQPATGGPTTSRDMGDFLWTAVAVLVVPPSALYLMVCLVGLTALPTYFNQFEKPEPS